LTKSVWQLKHIQVVEEEAWLSSFTSQAPLVTQRGIFTLVRDMDKTTLVDVDEA